MCILCIFNVKFFLYETTRELHINCTFCTVPLKVLKNQPFETSDREKKDNCISC
nr:MAG TPA: hypothetical protein [Caudoviricetes sp.]